MRHRKLQLRLKTLILQLGSANLQKKLSANEAKIVEELNSAQGVAMDIAAGYYSPNFDLASKAMRPSATLNAAVAAV